MTGDSAEYEGTTPHPSLRELVDPRYHPQSWLVGHSIGLMMLALRIDSPLTPLLALFAGAELVGTAWYFGNPLEERDSL